MKASLKNGYMIFIAVLILTGCTGKPRNFPMANGESGQKEERLPMLDDLGPAPELYNEIWLNSEKPLKLADLRGKVILLDMWTFG